MNFDFGKNIRKYRRRAGVTQETLGNALGLSAQAVSRWESGGGYPDMELIPAIANYFGITIDELFGYNSDQSLRIAEICNKFDDMERNRMPLDQMIQFIRLASAEFPASDEIMIRYANALYLNGWNEFGTRAYKRSDSIYVFNDSEYASQNDSWLDAIAILDNLVMTTGTPAIREQAVSLLVYLYRNTGRYDEAADIAYRQPTMFSSRELLLLQGTDGKERARYAGEALISLTRVFSNTICLAMSGRSDLCGTDRYIEKIKGIIALYELIYDDKNYGHAHSELCEIYLNLARVQWTGGQKEAAFESLDNALFHARAFDDMIGTGEYRYSASLLNEVTDNTYSWAIDRTTTRVDSLPDAYLLSEEVCPGLKKDPRFAKWLKKMKQSSSHNECKSKQKKKPSK